MPCNLVLVLSVCGTKRSDSARKLGRRIEKIIAFAHAALSSERARLATMPNSVLALLRLLVSYRPLALTPPTAA